MSELDDSQNANESEKSGQQLEVSTLPAADDRPPTAQDTPKLLENQEKPADAAVAGTDSLMARLQRRQRAIDDLLREKEGLQLSFVLRKTPKAYYLRWKAECNQIAYLNVSLQRRMKRAAGKS